MRRIDLASGAEFNRPGVNLSVPFVVCLTACLLTVSLFPNSLYAQKPFDAAEAAREYGQSRNVVEPEPEGPIILEAEEFQVRGRGGWQAKNWGENYYASTFANTFLSRKAFLGAPEQCDKTEASITVNIPKAGRYLALVRYEAAYRFETQFQLTIEQNGGEKFHRLYGARKNSKIWAFGQKIQKEVAWSWGAVENIVWEGHESFVDLEPGVARLTLTADRQIGDAARRNIDLVMLTTDVEQIKRRIENEGYLPLDGMLTQAGDVWLRVTNTGEKPLIFTGIKRFDGGNWQEHSPYWVHMRNWPNVEITAEPGTTSAWTDVGGTMDSLNDGQWNWTGNESYKAEFAVKNAAGGLEPIAIFEGSGELRLAADANTRYTRRLRTQDQVLFDLLAYLKNQKISGKPPSRVVIYGTAFEPSTDPQHQKAADEFRQMFGLTDPAANLLDGRGLIDVRSIPTKDLAEYCRKLGETASNVSVVSLGDEISLPVPAEESVDAGFRSWLRELNLRPEDIDPAAGNDWAKITYDPESKQPGRFYWSKRYGNHFGIAAISQRTDILRTHLPNAAFGANYTPYLPPEHTLLGEVHKWVSVFRAGAMTLPWSEDYVWQVPVGTPQMNNINLDLFRAANRGHPERKIMYYVMPHTPGNTPEMWRRLFFGALGHGMKIVNLFEFRPVQAAYTENYVDDPEMYLMIMRSLRELEKFEDIVADGRVVNGQTALWFSETGDIWGDNRGSFAAAKRSLYAAIRHQQIPLDFVVEEDALNGTLDQYKVLYITDRHVSNVAAKAIARWVRRGGRLWLSAGAGLLDELNRPNRTMRALAGIEPEPIEQPEGSQVTYLKQDLPFSKPIDSVRLIDADLPVYSVRAKFRIRSGRPLATFSDGSPAVAVRMYGKGEVTYLGFLPGLSYFAPAIPRRPVDRGAGNDAMSHFIPTDFDRRAASLIGRYAADVKRPVVSSQPLVESTIIKSPGGIAIPLVNWSGHPIKDLIITINATVPRTSITLASGRSVKWTFEGQTLKLTFDLDLADVLILR